MVSGSHSVRLYEQRSKCDRAKGGKFFFPLVFMPPVPEPLALCLIFPPKDLTAGSSIDLRSTLYRPLDPKQSQWHTSPRLTKISRSISVTIDRDTIMAITRSRGCDLEIASKWTSESQRYGLY